VNNKIIIEHHAAHPVDKFSAKVEPTPHPHKEFSSAKLDTTRQKNRTPL